MVATEHSALSRLELRVTLWFAVAAWLLHLVTTGWYGYFIDELYFLACSDRLDWGYVDMPPLLPAATAFSRWLLGDSLRAIRFLPAIASGLKILLTGLLACALGGGRFALALACVAVLAAPGYLAIDNYLSMNAFEPLFWMGCACVVILIFQGADRRLWLLFGALAGLGLENKYSMFFFGFALVVGLLLTPRRAVLLDRWFWLGGLVALFVYLPHLVWEIRRGWPMFELLRNQKSGGKYVPVTPLSFAAVQVLFMNPVNLPLWLTGLAWLLFGRDGRRYRAIGVAFLVLWIGFTLLEGKDYYLAPAYPMLMAAGAVALERGLARKSWGRPAGGVLVGLVVAGGIALAPLALPVLSPAGYVAYAQATGIAHASGEKRGEARLPQFLADQFGWPELTEAVAGVYQRLSPAERAQCVIFTRDYGEAGAIDFFGRRFGLPRAISGHNNYYLWGPGKRSGDVMIAVNARLADLEAWYDRVEIAARPPRHPYAMPDEADRPIYLCHGLRVPLREVWPATKQYY
jgi:4-amino-4-deoxy-L-arabinose transferase-like glycosyltransferase